MAIHDSTVDAGTIDPAIIESADAALYEIGALALTPKPLITERNPIRKGWAILTPNLFRQIDIAARTLAGKVFEVGRIDQMNCWGRMNVMAGGVLPDAALLRSDKKSIYRDMGLLEIAAEIPIREVATGKRPEIDLHAIPFERVMEYVGYHEIGHATNNFDIWVRTPPTTPGGWARAAPRQDGGQVHRLNEILADRYAWEKMFPGRAMPVRAGAGDVADWVGETIRVLEADGETMVKPRKPLDLDPLKWIPDDHVSKGFPWSKAARPELRNPPQWLIDFRRVWRDYAVCSRRRFKLHALDMVEAWKAAAKKPTKKTRELAREGRIHWLLHGTPFDRTITLGEGDE